MLTRRQLLKSGGGALVGASLVGRAAPAVARSTGSRDRRVTIGVEVLIKERLDDYAGRKFGIVTNPTGVLPDLAHEVDVLAAMRPEVGLEAVFGPEHGFRGTTQAGGSEGFYIDEKTGLPVYDTYLKRGQELADIFTRSGVDVVMFDIQDAGSRFYTYIWTLFDCMEAAVLSGKEFVVLDRPNPITGTAAEGPVLEPFYSTFVGRQPISQRHGMTVGELARLFNGEFLPDTVGSSVELTVIEMEGWKRDTMYWDTGLPWVLPSPNMPTVDTALVYPGTGMFEGTNLSEGRGTTRPFELIGAPYIKGALADSLRTKRLPGVQFREAYFIPTFSKYVNETVGGFQTFVTDPHEFDPIHTTLTVIIETKRLYPEDFEWRYDSFDPQRPYWIDKLTGSDHVRTSIDEGQSADEVVRGWKPELRVFQHTRRRYLLYR
ncbi:MAG TPA: DUF1343 domain-containing protein [Actinomycetota bacterium]|nr:DUF1343 domain-containing protein [Actinomycetota bacterium]